MRLLSFLNILTTLSLSINYISCTVIVPRQANNITYTTIFQLSNNGSWFENQIQRPNGQLLVSRADVCELWEVRPFNKTGALAVTFNNCTAALGIVEISRDVYAVVAGSLSLSTFKVTPGSWVIYRVDYSQNTTSPEVSLLSSMPEAELLNGAATFSSTTMLVADSAKGAVWKVNTNTGAYSLALSDPTMAPPNGSLGINGIKVLNDYVYYTSSGQALFCRIPVSRPNVTATGPAEVIARNFTMDDFTILSDGTAYIGGNPGTFVYEVSPSGNVSIAAGMADSLELAGATSVKFGIEPQDRGWLFVTTTGAQLGPVNGQIEPAKVVAVDLFAS